MAKADTVDVPIDLPAAFPPAFLDYLEGEFAAPRGTAMVMVDPSVSGRSPDEITRAAKGKVGALFKRWRARESEKMLSTMGTEMGKIEGAALTDDQVRGLSEGISGQLPHSDPSFASAEAFRNAALDREIATYDKKERANNEAHDYFRSIEEGRTAKRYLREEQLGIMASGVPVPEWKTRYMEGMREEAKALVVDTSGAEDAAEEYLNTRADKITPEQVVGLIRHRVDLNKLVERGAFFPEWTRSIINWAAEVLGTTYAELDKDDKKFMAQIKEGMRLGLEGGEAWPEGPSVVGAREMAAAAGIPATFSDIVPDVIGKLPLLEAEKGDAYSYFKELQTAVGAGVDRRAVEVAAAEVEIDPDIAVKEHERRRTGGETSVEGDLTTALDMNSRTKALRLALRRLEPDEWMIRYPSLVDEERSRDYQIHPGSLVPARPKTRTEVLGFLDEKMPADAWKEAEEGWQAVIGKRARESGLMKNAVLGVEDLWVGLYHMTSEAFKAMGNIAGLSTPSDRYMVLKDAFLESREKEYGELRGLYHDEAQLLESEAFKRSLGGFLAGVATMYEHILTDFDTAFKGDPVGTIASLVDFTRVARSMASKMSRGSVKGKMSAIAEKLDSIVKMGDQQIKNHLLVFPAASQYVRMGAGLLNIGADQISKFLRKPMPIAQDVKRAAEVAPVAKRSGALFSAKYASVLSDLDKYRWSSKVLLEGRKGRKSSYLDEHGRYRPHQKDTVAGRIGSMSDAEFNLYAHKRAWDEASAGLPPSDVGLIAQDVLKSVIRSIDSGLAGYVDDIAVDDVARVLGNTLSGDMRAFLKHVPEEAVEKAHKRLTSAGVEERWVEQPDFGPGYGEVFPPKPMTKAEARRAAAEKKRISAERKESAIGAPEDVAEYMEWSVPGVKAVPEGTTVRKVRIAGRPGSVDLGEVVNQRLHPGALSNTINRILVEADPAHEWTRPVTRKGVTKTAIEWEIENIREKIADGVEYPPPLVYLDEQTGKIEIPSDYPLSRAKLRGTHPRFTAGSKGSVQNAALLAVLIETLKDAPPGEVFMARQPMTHVPVLVPKRQVARLSGKEQVGSPWGVIDPDTGENISAAQFGQLTAEYKKRISVLEKAVIKQKQKQANISKYYRTSKEGIASKESQFIAAKERGFALDAKLAKNRAELQRLENQEFNVVRESAKHIQETLSNKQLMDEYGAANQLVREWHAHYVGPVMAKIDDFNKAEARLRVSIRGMAGYLGQPGGALTRKLLEGELRAAKKKVRNIIEVTDVERLLKKAEGRDAGTRRHHAKSAILSEDPVISESGRPYPEGALKLRQGTGEEKMRGIPWLQRQFAAGFEEWGPRPRPLRTNRMFISPDLGGYSDLYHQGVSRGRRGDAPVTQATVFRRPKNPIDDTYAKAMRDLDTLGVRMAEGFAGIPKDKVVNYLDDAMGLQRRRMSLELARVVGPELKRGTALMNGTLKIENEVDMPVAIPGRAADIRGAVEGMGGRTGVAARRMDYVEASPEHKIQMGLPESESVVIARPFAMALDDMKALDRWSSNNVASWAKSLGSILKREKVTRSIGFVANIFSSYMLRGFVDGVWSPAGLKRTRNLIRDYKLGKITDPKTLRLMEDFERLGLMSGIDKDIRLAVGASGGRVMARMFSEVVEGLFDGVDPTTMTEAQISKKMAGYSKLSPRRLLRMYNAAFRTLEDKYLAADPVFKVDAAMRVVAEYEKLLDDMAPGHSITVPISETQRVTLTKTGASVDIQGGVYRGLGETITTDTGISAREALLRVGALSANRKYFDYTFMPYRQQQARLAGLDVTINPMFAFTWNARWFPLMKRGLMREILTGSLDYSTTDPKLRGKQLAMVAKQVMKRQMMMFTSREAAMQQDEMPELMKMMLAFKEGGAMLDIVQITGPDEMNIIGYSGVSVAVDHPFFSFLDRVGGHQYRSPMAILSPDEMLNGPPERPKMRLEEYVKRAGTTKADTALTDKASLFEHKYPTSIPRASKKRIRRWLFDARRGDSEKFAELEGILGVVDGNAPGTPSMVSGLVDAILGFEGGEGLDLIGHYLGPIAQMISEGELDKASFRKATETILGSSALGDAVSAVLMSGDPEDFWRIVRKKKKHIRTLKTSLGRRVSSWRSSAYNDLNVNKEDMERAEAKYVEAADKGGVRGMSIDDLTSLLATQAETVKRRPGLDAEADRLSAIKDAYVAFQELEEKRRHRLISSAAINMQRDASKERMDRQARDLGIVRTEAQQEEPKFESTAPSVARVPFVRIDDD